MSLFFLFSRSTALTPTPPAPAAGTAFGLMLMAITGSAGAPPVTPPSGGVTLVPFGLSYLPLAGGGAAAPRTLVPFGLSHLPI